MKLSKNKTVEESSIQALSSNEELDLLKEYSNLDDVGCRIKQKSESKVQL